MKLRCNSNRERGMDASLNKFWIRQQNQACEDFVLVETQTTTFCIIKLTDLLVHEQLFEEYQRVFCDDGTTRVWKTRDEVLSTQFRLYFYRHL